MEPRGKWKLWFGSLEGDYEQRSTIQSLKKEAEPGVFREGWMGSWFPNLFMITMDGEVF